MEQYAIAAAALLISMLVFVSSRLDAHKAADEKYVAGLENRIVKLEAEEAKCAEQREIYLAENLALQRENFKIYRERDELQRRIDAIKIAEVLGRHPDGMDQGRQ